MLVTDRDSNQGKDGRRAALCPEEVKQPPKLLLGTDGHLAVDKPGAGPVTVTVRRCFPWSEPARFISLRDKDEEEVALISDLDDLDPDSRQLLETALAEAAFVFRVSRIFSVEEEFEIRAWVVETGQGKRSFQTARDVWPREVPGGGFLIRDVSGDLFHIPEPEKMDEKSQELLWALVD